MPGYQVKVTLEGTQPPVWRRILLPDRLCFGDLHNILQMVFGWEEAHLHDFSFQRSPVRIGDTETVDANADEWEVIVDEYLKEGWIRYTYDFGDDWQHKIVLEKELETYDKRYPTVIKHKGNNFLEDSGGIWGGESAEEPYEEAAVNALLEEECKFEPAGTVGYGDAEEIDEEYQELFVNFLNQYKVPGNRKKREHRAALDKKLEKISEFYDKAEVSTLLSGLKGDRWVEQQEQLAFNFVTGQVEAEHELPEQCFYKSEKDITQAQLLDQASEQQLLDYQKYLMPPPSGFSQAGEKVKFAVRDRILAVLAEHPEYCLILFSEETVQNYLSFMEYRPGDVTPFIPQETVIVLCAWGFWDAQVHEEKGKLQLEISAAKGNDRLLQYLEKARMHQIYGAKKLISDGISYLLKSYGFIEAEILHTKYLKAFGPIGYEDLMRYVYLDGRFYDKYVTGECLYGGKRVTFVAVREMDTELVLDRLEDYAQDLDYADFKNKRLLKWKEGIVGFAPEWEEAGSIFEDSGVVGTEELDRLMPELYHETLSGMDLWDLMAGIEDILVEEPESREGMAFLSMIWLSMAKCWLRTPIACLKGHSREEIGRQRGVNPFTVAVDIESQPEREYLEGDEQIYELPADVQEELFLLLTAAETKKDKSRLKAEFKRLSESIGRRMKILDFWEKYL